MLEELGLDYEFHPVHPRSGQTYTTEFLNINPRHKVPVLRHGEMVVTESAAIVEYLADAFAAPEELFVPRTPAERAKLHEWSYLVMTEFDAHTLYVIRRHFGMRDIYGEAPKAVDAAEKYFHDQLDAVSPYVGRSGLFLLGDQLSTADILFASCLDWAASYGMAVPQVVYDYHVRCISRPAYQRARYRTFSEHTPPVPLARTGRWDPATSQFAGK